MTFDLRRFSFYYLRRKVNGLFLAIIKTSHVSCNRTNVMDYGDIF